MRREIKEYIEDRLVKSPKPPRRWLKKTIPFKTAYACYVAGLSHAQTARVFRTPGPVRGVPAPEESEADPPHP